jgi:hypothetical protein
MEETPCITWRDDLEAGDKMKADADDVHTNDLYFVDQKIYEGIIISTHQ